MKNVQDEAQVLTMRVSKLEATLASLTARNKALQRQVELAEARSAITAQPEEKVDLA